MASTQYVTKVLITGANQGLGWYIAKKLATEHSDYHIIMSGRRKDAVEKAVADLKSQGLSNVESLVLDVSDDDSIAQAAQAVAEKHGRLDVLINNAGITGTGPTAESGKLTREQWNAVYNVNVIGAALATDAFMPLLEKSQAPTKRIVFMTSSLGSLGATVDPACAWRALPVKMYATSKSALNMLCVKFAIEHEGDPTWKINACCPGHCATNLNGYEGVNAPETGAINACRLATLGPEGETMTYSDKEGPIPW
jgi:NAD(P)-dependent dehydrogenase (short-subunit alcohol dehydrogenase family)